MPPWTVVVGDNAAGKTTLLRSIAIGLCDESSAAGLLKESDSGYVRFGGKKGKIVIGLVRSLDDLDEQYEIETIIEHFNIKGGYFERVRQKTRPSERFPWHDLFATGYGAGRGTSGAGDVADYSVINAVYNMFNYSEGLQNPELTILRLREHTLQTEVERVLKELMNVGQIKLRRSGIVVNGPWKRNMPLRDLADGYKSTFLWVTDFLGWAFRFDESIKSASQIEGIVIIDEVEQHLHATWQRVVIERLKELFPKVQFFAATHSPLIAASVGNLGTEDSTDKLILCESSEDSGIVNVEELETMQGYRFEQVLSSRAFKYLCEENPTIERAVQRASELADKGTKRSKDEEKEYQRLKEELRRSPFLGADTSIEREIEAEELKRLKDLEAKNNNDKDR
jgi:energy-coupling factor transporter ATP-binding protein EcfA2